MLYIKYIYFTSLFAVSLFLLLYNNKRSHGFSIVLTFREKKKVVCTYTKAAKSVTDSRFIK